MVLLEDLYMPDSCRGSDLDKFLCAGWYRSRDAIFTTNYVQREGTSASYVAWIRYDLQGIRWSKAALRIARRNRQFGIEVVPGNISREASALYHRYCEHVNHQRDSSLYDSLHSYRPPLDVFDTEVVEIRDGDDLIGVGYFDRGANSTAAINNFYAPEYRPLSVGKYLMLLQMLHTRNAGGRYYYPGYIVEQWPSFDYKLFASPEAIQVYSFQKKRWLPYLGLTDVYQQCSVVMDIQKQMDYCLSTVQRIRGIDTA